MSSTYAMYVCAGDGVILIIVPAKFDSMACLLRIGLLITCLLVMCVNLCGNARFHVCVNGCVNVF